ncbi:MULTISPECIES: hypothetical protein [Bacillus]|uniref:Integrase n=1 Tax=Bacillus capparidis TaxID=1840411 RepID=A0ABS4CQ62_9BACI|nr:hypothetical protein [Bacillus gobiensis]MBP1079704.1 integrase [Bacillus capparidis]
MNAIQKRTGHANLKVLSDTYSHVTPKMEQETSEKFDKHKPKKSVRPHN